VHGRAVVQLLDCDSQVVKVFTLGRHC
jgi:hypothetical protein